MKLLLLNISVAIILFSNNLAAQVPTAWQGQWRGKCRIQSTNNKTQQVIGVEMIIQSLAGEEWRWELNYEATPKRQYKLVAKDRDRFLLDEQNGILIVQTLFRSLSSFSSLFQVAGKLIAVQESLSSSGDEMTISMATHSLQSPLKSSTSNGDVVVSFQPTHLQICHLNKY
jgi:hypothetical protein